MSDDQFTKLFKYMEAFRKDVNERFAEIDRRFAGLDGRLAELSARVEDYHDEVLVIESKL